MIKRAFDLSFALFGLVLLAPVLLAIAVAVKLKDAGPVVYSQERMASFGDSFTELKIPCGGGPPHVFQKLPTRTSRIR